jgi:hypothetical protein
MGINVLVIGPLHCSSGAHTSKYLLVHLAWAGSCHSVISFPPFPPFIDKNDDNSNDTTTTHVIWRGRECCFETIFLLGMISTHFIKLFNILYCALLHLALSLTHTNTHAKEREKRILVLKLINSLKAYASLCYIYWLLGSHYVLCLSWCREVNRVARVLLYYFSS